VISFRGKLPRSDRNGTNANPSFLRTLLLVLSTASAFAQTPSLQTNVVYVCQDGQSFKVFSCNDANGACDYQNYKNGRAFQRGEALKAQLAVLLPAKCHAQTPAEAKADPQVGEIPPAPSPFKAHAPAAINASAATATAQSGGGPFKAGDRVRVLSDGWQDATVLQPRGNAYFVRMGNGVEVSKIWPTEVRREGKLTAQDHAVGQYDVRDIAYKCWSTAAGWRARSVGKISTCTT
jgi:hypothetical protein